MNMVFIGSSRFGLRCLEACMGLPDMKVVGVVTAPRTFGISYRPDGVTNVLHADVASFAETRMIPFKVIDRSMNESSLFEVVKSWEPDVFLVVGWYHMIPKSWRLLAPAYGVHASLLPDYSGGAPLVWAMINGEPQTGVTLFQLDDGVDSGPIVSQKEEPIYSDDTIASLYSRIETRGLELLGEFLPNLLSDSVVLLPQEESKRRIMPQRTPEDGLIDWSATAESIDRFIRAQTRPYPGAYTSLNGVSLIIWRAIVHVLETEGDVGTVYRHPALGYFVNCGKGSIRLLEVSHDSVDYAESNLEHLFGAGGQRLTSVKHRLS